MYELRTEDANGEEWLAYYRHPDLALIEWKRAMRRQTCLCTVLLRCHGDGTTEPVAEYRE